MANGLTGPFQGPCSKTKCVSHDVGFYNSKVISWDSFLANEKIVSSLFLCVVFLMTIIRKFSILL